MLELAYANQEELQKEFLKTKYNEKYKYYTTDYEQYTIKIEENAWNRLQFVSKRITSKDKEQEIIGFFNASIDRPINNISSLAIINFKEPNMTFSMNLMKFLHKLFEYKFNKISWSVFIGNPIEESYDKICKKFNGNIVGIRKKEAMLYTGEICDEKIYEILREDYLEAMSGRPNKNKTLKEENNEYTK